jgi:hypothetical protein
MSWGAKRRRLERLEQRTPGVAAGDRQLQLLIWMAERFGFGALDDEGVEPPTAEEQALLDEIDEDRPKYQPTPEEQIEKQFAHQQGTAAPDQPTPQSRCPTSPDVIPLPDQLIADDEPDADEDDY